VVSDPTDSDHIRITWELLDEEPAFALNPGVFVMWLHLNIFAKSRGRGKCILEKRRTGSAWIIDHPETGPDYSPQVASWPVNFRIASFFIHISILPDATSFHTRRSP